MPGPLSLGRSSKSTQRLYNMLHPSYSSLSPHRQSRTSRSQVLYSRGKIFGQPSVAVSTIAHTVDENNLMRRCSTQLRGRPSNKEDLRRRSPGHGWATEVQTTSNTPKRIRHRIDEDSIMTTNFLKGHPVRAVEKDNFPPMPQSNRNFLCPVIEAEIRFSLDASSIGARMSDRSSSPPLSLAGFSHIPPLSSLEGTKQITFDKKNARNFSHPLLEDLEQLTQGLPSHLQMFQTGNIKKSLQKPVISPRIDELLPAGSEYSQDDNLQARLTSHIMRVNNAPKGRFSTQKENAQRRSFNIPQLLKSPPLLKSRNDEPPINLTEDPKSCPARAEPLQRDQDCDSQRSPPSSSRIGVPHLVTPSRIHKALVIDAIKETDDDDEEEERRSKKQKTQERVYESEEENRLQLRDQDVSKVCTVINRLPTPTLHSSSQKQGMYRKHISPSASVAVQSKSSYQERISTIYEDSKEETERLETLASNFSGELSSRNLQPLTKRSTSGQETESYNSADYRYSYQRTSDDVVRQLTTQILQNISQSNNYIVEPIQEQRKISYTPTARYGRKRAASKENLPSFPTSPPRKYQNRGFVADLSHKILLNLPSVPEQTQEQIAENSELSSQVEKDSFALDNHLSDLQNSSLCSDRRIEEGFMQMVKTRFHQTVV